MKKILSILTIIWYLFTVTSLTHVFAMTNDFIHDDVQESSHYWCGHETKDVKDTNEWSSENSMSCCELIFSSEFEYIGVDKSFLLEDQNTIPCNFVYDVYDNSLENIGVKEVFSPPWLEYNKSVSYHNLVWVIKNLN